MAQQTAVEWLQELYNSRWEQFIHMEEFEIAKQMEKEQIMEAYRQGVQDCPKHNLGEIIRKEQYYNETYGTTNGS